MKSDGSIKQMCPRGCGITMERDVVANLQANPSVTGLATATLARDRKFPIVSDSLPEYAEGAQHDGEGRAVITSRAHAREVGKKNGCSWD